MNPMWASIIAVLGTLSAGLLSSWAQHRIARSQRSETHRRAQQDTAVEAVSHLVEALDAHRATMWLLENRRHANAGAAPDDVLEVSHGTRRAISAPLTRVRLLVPGLAQAARTAVTATYGMRDSADLDDLETRRRAALDAADRFVDVAAARFAALGIGLDLGSPVRGELEN